MPETPVRALDARVRKQFDNAKLAIDRGNHEYAIEICSTLLDEEPGCLEARRLLRKAQHLAFANRLGRLRGWRDKLAAAAIVAYGRPYARKKPRKAMRYGERALTLNPFHSGALSLIAAGSEALGLYDTAVFCLQSVYEQDNQDLLVMRRYCEALIKTGETDQALAVAERLRKLKPESVSIQELVKSASVAHSIHQGKWAEEERDFRAKLKDGELAESLEREHRLAPDDATADLRARDLAEAIQRDPQNLDLYKRLARTLVAKEDFRNALDWLDRALQLPQGGSDYALRQMKSEISIRATEQELERLQFEGQETVEDAKRASVLKTELEYLKLEDARKMVEQFPNDFGQRLRLGELLLQAGWVDEAIQQFQISQRSANLKNRSHVLLGRSFMIKGLYDLALEQFDQALRSSLAMDEFKKDALYTSAECCEKLGKEEEAIRRYKQIYSSDIGFRDVAGKIDASYGRDRKNETGLL